jgi:ABC-type multidrug transport system ATPase subunit
MLKRLKEQGITILVSTPYMDEAGLCDRVVLMQTGKVLSINTPQQIVNNFGKPLWAVRSNNMLHLLKELKVMKEVENAYPSGTYHHVIMKGDDDNLFLQKQLTANNSELDIKKIAPNIEDCFMQLMR